MARFAAGFGGADFIFAFPAAALRASLALLGFKAIFSGPWDFSYSSTTLSRSTHMCSRAIVASASAFFLPYLFTKNLTLQRRLFSFIQEAT